jgi:hypothetical protein
VYQENSSLRDRLLFKELNHYLGGHKFKENGDVETAVTTWLSKVYTK